MAASRQSGRGLFITFEGMDGSGKSTQMRLLAGHLREDGCRVTETAEPGGTPIGVQIRQLLLDHRNHDLSPTAELLLYFASRAQAVDQWIEPALSRGEVVLSDRFTDSTRAYQGAARNLGSAVVDDLDRIACHGIEPDLTLLFDVDLQTSLVRARGREAGGDRMEAQAAEFYTAVRTAYSHLAAQEPHRIRVIDGHGSVEQVAERVWAVVAPLLPAGADR